MLNRLIIVGNGFDLAHGLKTKYSDYIEHYWKNCKYNDNFINLFSSPHPEKLKSFKGLLIFLKEIGYSLNKIGSFYRQDKENILEIKNDFFHWINHINDDVNWVDIEMEYYKYLKKLLNKKLKISEGREIDLLLNEEMHYEQDQLKAVTKLNSEITDFSNDFEEYLKNNVMPLIQKVKNEYMEEIFSDTLGNGRQEFYKEFPTKDINYIIPTSREETVGNKKFGKTLILNFNYTSTPALYRHEHDCEIINIHGQIGDIDNPINIGFGDENDKFYTMIEGANQNEYLRFMKSFVYSNNNNYKNLFDFIDTSSFQTYIMGHSCGLSDRTLLNAVFENHNCKSIKVFYHKRTDNYGDDNYLEIVKNISRHFTKKTMMREKIVNKTLCTELPQNKIE
jgi:hypothetical protein